MKVEETTRTELIRDIALTLARKQRLAFASDFHAFVDGRALTLAGVTFEDFPKGPNTKRSDGDVVSHAIVMALTGAVNRGDIDDWFPDTGETGVRSLDYLPDMRRRLVESERLVLGVVQDGLQGHVVGVLLQRGFADLGGAGVLAGPEQPSGLVQRLFALLALLLQFGQTRICVGHRTPCYPCAQGENLGRQRQCQQGRRQPCDQSTLQPCPPRRIQTGNPNFETPHSIVRRQVHGNRNYLSSLSGFVIENRRPAQFRT